MLLVVFTLLVHNAKHSIYYVRDCLRKFNIQFLLIWRRILTYFDIILDEKHNFLWLWAKKTRKSMFLSLNQTFLKLEESGLLENLNYGKIIDQSDYILGCMDAKLIFLYKIRLEITYSCIVLPEISFFWFQRQSGT